RQRGSNCFDGFLLAVGIAHGFAISLEDGFLLHGLPFFQGCDPMLAADGAVVEHPLASQGNDRNKKNDEVERGIVGLEFRNPAARTALGDARAQAVLAVIPRPDALGHIWHESSAPGSITHASFIAESNRIFNDRLTIRRSRILLWLAVT